MISPWCGLALQFGGAVVIAGFITAALVSLSLGRDVLRARLLVAEGVIGGLGVMTAATLLRTIASHLAPDPDIHANPLPAHPAEEGVRVGEAPAF